MTCSNCGRTRWYGFTISRSGGGNYRRAGRNYRGWICLHCAESLVDGRTETAYAMQTADRYPLRDLIADAAKTRAAHPLVPYDIFAHPTELDPEWAPADGQTEADRPHQKCVVTDVDDRTGVVTFKNVLSGLRRRGTFTAPLPVLADAPRTGVWW